MGCATQHLRNAQDHFSTAARAENAKILDDPTAPRLGDLILTDAEAVNEYRLACEDATRAVAENAAPSTDQERLELGTARMLQLYSRWRLVALGGNAAERGPNATAEGAGDCIDGGDVGGVTRLVATIDQEKAAGMISLGERERVMLNAIPALLEHELGLGESSDWPAAREHMCRAVTGLEEAASDAAEDHPVRAFLYLAQIRALDVWVDKTNIGIPADDIRRTRLSEVNPLIVLPVCGIEAWRKTIGEGDDRALRVRSTAIRLTDNAGFTFITQAQKCGEPRPELPVCTCSAGVAACN
jgi:hypothetical protein